jgi:hypothetical protein
VTTFADGGKSRFRLDIDSAKLEAALATLLHAERAAAAEAMRERCAASVAALDLPGLAAALRELPLD